MSTDRAAVVPSESAESSQLTAGGIQQQPLSRASYEEPSARASSELPSAGASTHMPSVSPLPSWRPVRALLAKPVTDRHAALPSTRAAPHTISQVPAKASPVKPLLTPPKATISAVHAKLETAQQPTNSRPSMSTGRAVHSHTVQSDRPRQEMHLPVSSSDRTGLFPVKTSPHQDASRPKGSRQPGQGLPAAQKRAFADSHGKSASGPVSRASRFTVGASHRSSGNSAGPTSLAQQRRPSATSNSKSDAPASAANQKASADDS